MRLFRGSKDLTIKKLRGRAGETITETLVALLIAALALTMLAGAISASGSIVTKSRAKLNTYYTTNETTVVGMTSTNEDEVGTTTIEMKPKVTGTEGTDTTIKDYPVTYYKNGTFSKSPVIAYKLTNQTH